MRPKVENPCCTKLRHPKYYYYSVICRVVNTTELSTTKYSVALVSSLQSSSDVLLYFVFKRNLYSSFRVRTTF
jgi:hypothetical protein